METNIWKEISDLEQTLLALVRYGADDLYRRAKEIENVAEQLTLKRLELIKAGSGSAGNTAFA